MYSLMVVEAKDHSEQLVLCVWYVSPQGLLKERFLGFSQLEAFDPSSVIDITEKELEKHGITLIANFFWHGCGPNKQQRCGPHLEVNDGPYPAQGYNSYNHHDKARLLPGVSQIQIVDMAHSWAWYGISVWRNSVKALWPLCDPHISDRPNPYLSQNLT